MTCPSRFELARWGAAGPPANGPAGLSSHVERCARCAGVLAELEAARHELLGPDPAETSRRAAQRIQEAVAERRAARRFRLWLPIGLAPVAAGLLLFVLGQNPALEPGVRAKGPLVVEAVCKRGETIFPVKEGADFFAGDRLRFSYTKAEPGFLMVFGVDDAGRISPYYEDGILSGIQVGAGSKLMLPGSVELDDHRGWERVFALWSPRPLDERAVRSAVSRALANAGGDVRRAARLDLEAEQVSYLLRRP